MRARGSAVLAVVVTLASCTTETRELPPCPSTPPETHPAVVGSAVVLVAGDIADPEAPEGARATAALLDGMRGLVLTVGDNVQKNGGIDELLDVYEPKWGRHRFRTRPVPGNHEYRTPHAGAYFAYFCDAAGPAFEGYYSFDFAGWHFVALNSACAEHVGPSCDAGEKQEAWLRADLAAHPSRCTLAYWHHPRFSSAEAPGAEAVAPLWDALDDAGVDVVLNGHDHAYERFAPRTRTGTAANDGMRAFVVGTGGATLGSSESAAPLSEVRVARAWGVLRLALGDGAYRWERVGVDGTIDDRGSGSCR